MLAIEKYVMQFWLDVAVPQHCSTDPTTERAEDDLPHHRSTRQIEPQAEVGPIGESIPHNAVLPLGDPGRAGDELVHVLLERDTGRPVRPVI